MTESFYVDEVVKRFNSMPLQESSLRKAAEIVTDGVLNGGKVWVYDREEALSCDANVRASGLFLTSNVYTPEKNLSANDILIIGAVEPDDPGDIEIAIDARKKGAKVIALAADGIMGRGSRGRLLKDEADIFIDNLSPEVSGIMNAEGMEDPFCPTSGVMNCLIFWALCAAVVDELFDRGLTPTVYRGVHLFYGREYNRRASERFRELGY